MTWIKRNLYFLISALVALGLLGLSGWFFYSKWQLNNDILAQLDEQYGKLENLNKQPILPGGGKVDNIKAAKEQQQQLRAYMQKARADFQPISPIPDSPKPTSEQFSTALSRTIEQLLRDSTNASVTLPPPRYNFSFEAQKLRITFAPGSLEPLSVQLGEVKAICDVLFSAGINSLDGIQRVRVSTDDDTGPPTDYLMDKSVTNELAVLTPYQLTFRCFTPELSAVLEGFASSPHCLLVKTINVELAGAAAAATTPEMTMQPPVPQYQVPQYPVPPQPGTPYPGQLTPQERYAQRYRPEGRYAPQEGESSRPRIPVYTPPPQPVMPAEPAPGTQPAAGTPTTKGGLQTVLDEKQLKVTLMLEVVKLLNPKS